MEPLTWTGSIAFLNPLLMIALAALFLSILVWIIASIFLPEQQIVVNPDGSVSSGGGVRGLPWQLGPDFPAAAIVAAAHARYIADGVS